MINKGFLIVLFLCSSALVYAQRANYSTPRRALTTYFVALQADTYDLSRAAMLFRSQGVSIKEAEKLAVMLKQSLDGRGLYIEMADVPDVPNYVDTLAYQARYVLTSARPEIYLERKGLRWLFPPSTHQAIYQWHRRLFPFGMNRLLTWLPKMGGQSIGPLHLWQVFMIGFLLFLCAMGYQVVVFIFKRLLLRLIKRLGYGRVEPRVLLRTVRPLGWLAALGIILLGFPLLQAPVQFGQYVQITARIFLPIFISIAAYYAMDVLYACGVALAKRTVATLDDQLLLLVRKILKVLIVFFGVIFTLDSLSVSILPLLTGLSIGGLAFALAAQDTLKNFFGSLMIFMDKPFKVGDWISCGEIDGTVEKVGLRSTRVRTFRDSLMYIPNARLSDALLDNHGLRTYRRYYTMLRVHYNTDPTVLDAFIAGLNAIVDEHPKTRKDEKEIYLNGFGTTGLEIMLYIFFRVPNWSAELKARHEINRSVLALAKKLNVTFTYAVDLIDVKASLPNPTTPELPADTSPPKP